MYRRTPIFTAVDPALVSSGLLPDVHPAKAPLWAEGAGVEFINGKVRHKKGNSQLVSVSTSPTTGIVQQRLSNGEIAVWWVQGGNLYRWDQFSLQVMKTYAAGSLLQPYFDFTPYGDWLFVNRGVGSIEWFNGVTFTTLPEMPTNVRQLRKHLSFLLALGVGSKGTGVAWSDANDVSKWIAARNNSAGALYIDEFDGGIVTGEQLGPVVAVYSENQMALVSFIGAPFYFGQKVMLSGIGAVGATAVTSAGGMNYGVGRQGIWATDGQDYRYIDGGKLNDYFQDEVNWSMARKILAVRNDVRRTVEFHLPMRDSSELNEAWSFDPATAGWSQINPVSYYDEDLALGLPVAAMPDGVLQLVGGQDFSTETLLLRTKPMLMQLQSGMGLTDAHFNTKVDEIELLVHDARAVRMRIGSSKEYDSTVNWSSYMTVDPSKSTYKVPAGVPDGTYWHLEFSNTTTATEVEEAAVLVEEEGEQVVATGEDQAWRLDLQGFLLYGIVEGSKDAR